LTPPISLEEARPPMQAAAAAQLRLARLNEPASFVYNRNCEHPRCRLQT
jgi:hypothetical protein